MNEQGKDLYFEYLRFRSISTDSAYQQSMQDCATWLKSFLANLGFISEVMSTNGHPVVVARRIENPSFPTVLIYGHYDVQPADPIDSWESDPFEPEIREGRVWARGATDNKGQLMAHLLGIKETLEQEGSLPVNLTFLIEGEEEIGSPNLDDFLKENRELLKNDIIVISDTGMVAQGCPTLTYGLRGIATCQLTIEGSKMDLHSGGFGGAILNPARELSRLLVSLHDADGRVAIQGFYDEVVDIEDWERQAWTKIPHVDDESIAKIAGVEKLVCEKGYSGNEAINGRPTAEINGLHAGYTGEGFKTVLPAKAYAKISFRLVANQSPDTILELTEAHFRARLTEGMKISFETGDCGQAYAMDPNSDYGKLAQLALEDVYQKKTVLIREGGSIPIVKTMSEILESEVLLLGLGLPDCQIHAPNENFRLTSLEKGIELNRALLMRLESKISNKN